MRGLLKLYIYRRFKHVERYKDAEDRGDTLRRWIADFNLFTKPHYITIIPDAEEVEEAYDRERIKGYPSCEGECGIDLPVGTTGREA